MFYDLKVQINALLKDIAEKYDKRTQEILDSTSKEAFDIVVDYGKNGGLANYFYRPIDPSKDKKPYDPKKYHYFRDKETIERYLNNGYKYLQQSRNIFNDPDFSYILSKETKTSRELDYIMDKYINVIDMRRQSKQYGIEIYRLINSDKISESLKTYDVTILQVQNYPIYDKRIPADYKIDATDNLEMIYSIEQKRIGEIENK